MDNMTAKVSCFARAFHFKNNSNHIFEDCFAHRLLGDEDYAAIASHMTKGIHFFAPGFEGSPEEALTFIVDTQLSPNVLGRSAFNQRHLENECKLGLEQYIIMASGYDTYAYNGEHESLLLYELDLPEMIEDKMRREDAFDLPKPKNRMFVSCDLANDTWPKALLESGFQPNKKTYISLLGISFYFEKNDFSRLLGNMAMLVPQGSALCFDYPSETEENRENREGENSTWVNSRLAKGAGEEMKASYTYREMESLLLKCGFLVYEHLNAADMTAQYFEPYNQLTEKAIMAPKCVDYILAVRDKL